MTQQNEWTHVGSKADLVPGAGIGARFDDRQVAIFYIPELEQSLFAVDNYCPVSGVNIIARGIVGDINGEPVVATPLYKKHFSLVDGRCLEAPEHELAIYRVRFAGEEVQIARRPGNTGIAA